MSNRRFAPLLGVTVLALPAPGEAQTVISNTRTSPISTSTATSGSPGDIRIDDNGRIELTQSGPAVTLDSPNTVTLQGAISLEDLSRAVGVLLRGGVSGRLTNEGTITILDTTSARDTDDDGDNDGLFATTRENYGIRLTGPGAFVGSVINTSDSAISVEGIASAGISIETGLQGDLQVNGGVSIVGDQSVGVISTARITGDVVQRGSISATGEGAIGLSLSDVDGGVTIQSSVISTGYRSTTRSTDQDVIDALDADDLLQGGPAVDITGNLGRGLLVDVPPTDDDENNDDEDGDGTDDAEEGSGVIASYGAAPGLRIGGDGRDIRLGAVGQGENAFGLIIKGSSAGYGTYDGVAATGVEVGRGSGAVDIVGGIRVDGSVLAQAFAANATGLRLKPGAVAPLLSVDGAISAGVASEGRNEAIGLDIEAGASVSTLRIGGQISAALSGEAGDAIAVRDRGGVVRLIETSGLISAGLTATDNEDDADDADEDADNETVTGKAVALDLSASTAGVRIRQFGVSDGDDGDDGEADDDEDGDGVDDADEPLILGEIRLGSGADSLEVENGRVEGDISFGAGANRLLILGGAEVEGRINATGGTLAVDIQNGALRLDEPARVPLSDLTLGAKGSLILTADPATGAATRLDVQGAARLESGARIGLRLTSFLAEEATYRIITARSLSVGALDSSLLGDIPFLYSASLRANTSAGEVSINLKRKSATDIGLPAATREALGPLLGIMARDEELSQSILEIQDRDEFIRVYNQLLPEHQGFTLDAMRAATRGFSRAIEDRETSSGDGIWLQEITGFTRRDGSQDVRGNRALTLGLIGGLEGRGESTGVLGLSFGFHTTEFDTREAATENYSVSGFEAGGYWRLATDSGLNLSARVAGDVSRVAQDRVVQATYDDGASVLGRTAEARWNAWSLNSQVAATYTLSLGRAYLRPRAAVEGLWVRESGYSETGSGLTDLHVSGRTHYEASGTLGLAAGVYLGDDTVWAPEIQAGWREVFTQKRGDTIARFKADRQTFRLLPGSPPQEGMILRAGIRRQDPVAAIVIDGGFEQGRDSEAYDARISIHLRF